MSALATRVQAAVSGGRKLLVPYLTGGWPDPETFVDLVARLHAAGADLIEIGVPFSDPLADGRTIESAAWAVLEAGLTLDALFALCARCQPAPLVLMGYANPILARGPERFFADAAAAGAIGVIVPDLPPEAAAGLLDPAPAHGVGRVFLVAPNTPDERIGTIGAACDGLLYCVSLAGTTGARTALPATLVDYLARVRRATSQPFVVGFGISTPQIAAQVARHADGVVVGSALMDAIARDPDEGVALIAAMRKALDAP